MDYSIGDRIQLTQDIDALSNKAKAGDQGIIEGIHVGSVFEVRMDNGRTQFPYEDEMELLVAVEQTTGQQ